MNDKDLTAGVPPADVPPAVESLIQKHIDGLATPEDYQQLADQLARDPESRRRYARYLQLHALLSWESVATTSTRGTPAREKVFVWWPTAAIVAVALLGFGGWLFGLLSPRPTTQKGPRPVAKLTWLSVGNWMDGQGPKVGDDVFPGTYVLLEGNAELQLANGGTVLVEAPTNVQLLKDGGIVLHRGSIVARAPSTQEGSTIETVDGTSLTKWFEIGVAVTSTGKTTVQVFRGQATVRLKGRQNEPHTVGAGKAVEIDKRTSQMRVVQFSSKRFVRELPNHGEKAYTWLPPYNRQRHDAMSVPKAPENVTIDGRLDEWEQKTAITAHLREPFTRSFHFSGQMMYDRRCLYAAAHVGDPAPMRNVIDPQVDPEGAWKGGGVQVRLSTSPDLGWPLKGRSPIGVPRSKAKIGQRPEDVSPNLVHLTMWYYHPEQKPCLVLQYGMDYQKRLVNPKGWKGAFRRDENGRGYTLEYAIPWNLLNAAERPPRAGDVLGASWQVHWSDQGGRLWRGHIIELTRPGVEGPPFLRASKWGKAVYR